LVLLASTTSTNDEARALAASGAPDGTVVVAEHQTAGRGRLGRTWHSPAGRGLYLSVLLRPEEAPDRLGRYTLAAAVAVCRACGAAAKTTSVGIKWPNDILAGGRKLAGILAEVRSGPSASELVIGIGVNVDHLVEEFPAELRDRVTSLRLLGAAPADRAGFAETVLGTLGEEIVALRSGGWDAVAGRFLAYAPAAEGASVRLATGDPGTTRGLDASGALRVETARGLVVVHAGESLASVED
jgi:BirA family biotin operon repressor/biotin-[acetyl-CoA-carboxylase] ligase